MAADVRGSIEIHSLAGRHYDLTGVGTTNPPEMERLDNSYGDFDNASSMSFILDGVGYCAIEDPNDGYRSSLQALIEIDPASIANRFEPVRVLCRLSQREPSEVVEFVDVVTKKVVLEVGTDHADDYYPSFVASFNPAAMHLNNPVAPPPPPAAPKEWGTW